MGGAVTVSFTPIRVALYCVIDSLTGSYSLTEVLLDQAKLLALHGHPVEIWLLQDWRLDQDPVARQLMAEYPNIELIPCVPRLRLYRYESLDQDPDEEEEPGDPVPGFARKVERLVAAMRPHVERVPVVFMHDLLFQTAYLAHGAACRQLATLSPRTRWVHWQHSGPDRVPQPLPAFPQRLRFVPMPNTTFVYLNDDVEELERVGDMRGLDPSELEIIPNPRDPLEYHDADPLVKRFVRYHRLLDAELLFLLPARLDEGKQPRKAIMTVQAFRLCGVDARLVFAAAFCNPRNPEKRRYLDDLRQFARDLGMPDSALLFTCEAHSEWFEAVPRRAVRELQLLADGFLLPSLSEAHSLAAMEAALCRNLLLLNLDFSPMRTWFPTQAVYWYRWCSKWVRSRYLAEGDPEAARQTGERERELGYYRKQAQLLLRDLRRNRSWLAFNHQKRHGHYAAHYRRYYAPLLESLR